MRCVITWACFVFAMPKSTSRIRRHIGGCRSVSGSSTSSKIGLNDPRLKGEGFGIRLEAG